MILAHITNWYWEKLHWQKLQKEEPTLFTPTKSNSQTFSIIIPLPTPTANLLYKKLCQLLPPIHHLLLQPPNQYHITIQWTGIVDAQKHETEILAECEKVIRHTKIPLITMIYPHLSIAGLIATVKTNRELLMLRKEINIIWQTHGLSQGVIGLKSHLAWVSLTRFTSLPSKNLLNQLHTLSQQAPISFEPSQVSIVYNDPLLSPEKTRVLKTIQLKT